MLPVYVSNRGEHPAWDGWCRPTRLSEDQAREFSALLQAKGKCGDVIPSKFFGFCVCDRTCGYDDDVNGHEDGRHAVVWDHAKEGGE